MNSINKYRILYLLLGFVGIVVISGLTSLVVINSGVLNRDKPLPPQGKGVQLQSELGLTPAQTIKVEQINTNYKETTAPLKSAIRSKKVALIDELSKAQTDTNKLAQIAEELSMEQKKLQKANIRQFLDLKQVCDTIQTKKLSQIYSELYGCDGNGPGKGKGQGQGMQHRHRYGQQKRNGQ